MILYVVMLADYGMGKINFEYIAHKMLSCE